MNQPPRFAFYRYLSPRYWPTWAGLGLLRLSIFLPLPLLLGGGRLLGDLFRLLPLSQKRIARINIGLCFPELDAGQQRRLTRDCLRSVTTAIFEAALAWWASDRRLHRYHRVEGLEHLREAQKTGRGILLLGGHYTTLELGGRLISLYVDGIGIYKPAHNKLFEAVMAQARRRIFADLIPSKEMRKIIRSLKQGGVCWYAPDQDFGRQGTVFAPFMGVPAASLTMTARLARLSNAIVLPYSSRRLPGGEGYAITLLPPLENFPAGDDIADATTVNRAIEAGVRLAPEQYLWVHRRFKTRPPGEPQLYPLRRDRRLRRYSRLLFALSLPALAYTGWMAWRQRDREYFKQRLGLLPKAVTGDRRPVWIHAASVGEVNAVLPLIKALLANWPELAIHLTTTTPSGQATARARLPDTVECSYLPLDWWRAVNRFLRSHRPAAALIVETEIWPNLYEACFQHGVPLSIINGRLSARTLDTRPWIRALYCKALENTHAVLARSEEDARGFASLAVPEDRIEVLGNIKFAAAEAKPAAPLKLARPWVLAASTREGEELLIARQWRQQASGERLLIIVPRHPGRRAEILRELAPLGCRIRVRSRGEEPDADTDIYLADTFGELPAFIAGSEFVIMGGSFVPKGGQNILEVARAGKAVIFGPHMDNFRDEARLFLQAGAGVRAEDAEQLGEYLARWLAEPALAQTTGEKGQILIESQQQILQRYLERLRELYPAVFPA